MRTIVIGFVRLWIHDLGIKQTQLATILNVDDSKLSRLLLSESKWPPTDEAFILISTLYELNRLKCRLNVCGCRLAQVVEEFCHSPPGIRDVPKKDLWRFHLYLLEKRVRALESSLLHC